MSVLTVTPAGLYCEAGDFFIDPWRPVGRAVITHAHSDHARWGSERYLCSKEGEGVLRTRLGNVQVRSLDYGEALKVGDATVSLHPAGHILGSSQVRVEVGGEIWVVSGDYKTGPDSTCTPWEPVRCNTFITESTFGLPIYRWPSDESVFNEINRWWRTNQEAGKTSVLMGYALGKAQRLIAGLDPSIGPIYVRGAVQRLNDEYRAGGVPLPETLLARDMPKGTRWNDGIIVAPPSVQGTPWLRRFGTVSAAFASGWMRIRGVRRRRAVDRGFVLSDHVDWPTLLEAIDATGCEQVWVTHGYTAQVVQYLRDKGMNASVVETEFGDDDLADAVNDDDEVVVTGEDAATSDGPVDDGTGDTQEAGA